MQLVRSALHTLPGAQREQVCGVPMETSQEPYGQGVLCWEGRMGGGVWEQDGWAGAGMAGLGAEP